MYPRFDGNERLDVDLENNFHKILFDGKTEKWRRVKKTILHNRVTLMATVLASILSFLLLLYYFIQTNALLHSTTNPTTPLITAENGIVATDNAQCSQVGLDILKNKNGTAVDAAIASCICLGVLQPFASGIGGGGILVVYLPNGTVDTIDFREVAPALATKEMFENASSQVGGLSIAVPSLMAGLEYAWKLYGRAKWADLFEASIKLAEKTTVHPLLARSIQDSKEKILNSSTLSSLLAPGGRFLQEGDEFRQPALAKTLRTLAKEGASAFYSGSIAKALIEDIRENNGIITHSDLVNYYSSGVKRRPPVSTHYHGYKIYGAAVPISGGVCTSFAYNILEGFNLPLLGFNNLSNHLLIESWKYTFSNRRLLGDPAFVNLTRIIPEMLSKDHAAQLRQYINFSRTYEPVHYLDLVEENSTVLNDSGTSHMSIVDKDRMAVALTNTVNLGWGSTVLSLQTGVLLNDEMDDFSSLNDSNGWDIPPSKANYVAGGKEPLSSMTPTIVLKDNKLFMVVGGSGGPKIITSTMQVLLQVLAFGKNIAEAIALPRCHNQLIPPITQVESNYPQELIDELMAKGHEIQKLQSTIAAVQGIVISQNGTLFAASDWRKLGLPAGY